MIPETETTTTATSTEVEPAEPAVTPGPESAATPDDPATQLEAERVRREAAEAAAKKTQAIADRLGAKLKKLEDAEKSELELAQSQAAEAQQAADAARAELRQAKVLAGLSDQKHGIVSPAAAAKLIEGVEFDDGGNPTNLDDRIEALLADNSFLKATAPTVDPSNPANPAKKRQGPSMTHEEISELAKTNPAEFNRKFEAGEIPASALGA